MFERDFLNDPSKFPSPQQNLDNIFRSYKEYSSNDGNRTFLVSELERRWCFFFNSLTYTEVTWLLHTLTLRKTSYSLI